MITTIRRQYIALAATLLFFTADSSAQDLRTFNQNAARSNRNQIFNQNDSRSNRGLSISFSPVYSTAVNASKDSLLFRGSGGGLRFGADYFFGMAGIGISSGFGSSSADDANINNFLKTAAIPQDQLEISKSNQQNMYLLLGPSVRFGNKVQLYAHAKGGLFINNGGLVNIQQKGAQRAAYRNESTGKSIYPGFQTGLNLQYSLKSDTWSFGIGADYMNTKTEVMNYDIRRGGGIEGLKLSRNISDIVAGVTIRYNITSPRDHASGQATGRRVLPTVNKREISPRDAASGLPTGRRSYQPGQPVYGNLTSEGEDMAAESCGPVTTRVTHPDGTSEEMTFSCPADAAAYAERKADITEMETRSSNAARPVSNAEGSKGIISGRLTWPSSGNTGIVTNAVISSTSPRSGSTTMNSQTSSTRTTQQSSFGTMVRMSARDVASGMATGKRSRDAASGLSTGRRSRDVATGLSTGKRSRDAASGLSTGRRQYEPVFVEGSGEVCNPCLATVRSNPLYKDNGVSGTNPLHTTRTAGGDDDCDGIVGIDVSLIDMNSGSVVAKTQTEQCGDFFFANVPEGDYIVRVSGSFLSQKGYDASLKTKTDLLGSVEVANQSAQLFINAEDEGDGMQQKAGISTSRSNIRTKSIAIIEADVDGDGEYESLRAIATFSDGSSEDITSSARMSPGTKSIVLEGSGLSMGRRRVEVLKSNKQGDPGVSRISAITMKSTGGHLTATGTFSDGSSRDITDNIEVNTKHAGIKQYNITVSDSDDDGIADAVIKTKTKSNQSNDRVAAGDVDGDGRVEAINTSKANLKTLSIATGDVNGDGFSDIMVGAPFVPGGAVVSAAMRPGNPIGGLNIKGGKNPGGNMRASQTDEYGEFEFTDLEPGDYTFTVEQRIFIEDETPVSVGNTTRAQDHNSSRSNKTASRIAGGPNNNNNTKVQDHNSSRSNKSSSSISQNPDDNGNTKVQDHNSSRSNKTASNVGPVKWAAPEATRRTINTTRDNIKSMLTSLDQLEEQLDADVSNERSIVNTSRSNIKNQRMAMYDLRETMANMEYMEKEKAISEINRKTAAMNARFDELEESVQQLGRQFTSISNVLKTKHDTVKNSIGNIR